MTYDQHNIKDMNVTKFIANSYPGFKNILSAILFAVAAFMILALHPHDTLAAQSGAQKSATHNVVQLSRIEFVTRLNEQGEKIAISSNGQIFVLIKGGDEESKIYTLKKDGSLELFPGKSWYGALAREGDPPYRFNQRFFAPKAIRATLKNSLMVLDAGDAHHSARITDFDLTTRAVLRSFYIPAENLAPHSMLTDMGYDWEKAQAYILDSGSSSQSADQSPEAEHTSPPAIIFYNLKDGTMMRRSLLPPASQPHTDGAAIILDVLNDNLYVALRHGAGLQRAEISEVSDVTLTNDAVSKNIETLGTEPAGGGMAVDAKGNVYIGRMAQHEIGVINGNGDYAPYITDARIGTINSMAFAPNGYIYALMRSESAMLDAKNENAGDTAQNPAPEGYFVIRFKPLWPGSVGG